MNPLCAKGGLLLLGAGVCPTGIADSVTPEEPEAYEPFTIEIDVADLNAYYSPHVNVEGNEILLLHMETYEAVIMHPPDVPIVIEVRGLPPGIYTVKTVELPDTELDGEIIKRDTGFSIVISEAPATQRAYAFYHEEISHYFVTASDQEADGIILPGQGWRIIDHGFNVWHADDPAPSAAVPVCRFYSDLVNSHFYTGDEEECTMLQEEDHGWEYEGIAFHALIPTGGACPAGTDPVWRLFNGRVAELDSNHRFVASSETYRTMMADGWIGEGVAFCSPPASEVEG